MTKPDPEVVHISSTVVRAWPERAAVAGVETRRRNRADLVRDLGQVSARPGDVAGNAHGRPSIGAR
jgi:hypothetical protein